MSNRLQVEELEKEVSNGNREKAIELMEIVRPSMISFLRKKGCSIHDAEDIVQTTFLKFLQTYKYDYTKSSFLSWMNLLASQTRINNHRVKKNRLLHELPIDVVEQKTEISEDLEFYEKTHKIINNLPSHFSFILNLLYFREFTCLETASACNIPIGTVKSRMSAAKSFLKKELEKDKDFNEN